VRATKHTLERIERGDVEHYCFQLTNNTTNHKELLYILVRLVEPFHTLQYIAHFNIIAVFFEPTTMIAGVEEKLQNGEEIASALMSAFGVTTHERRHMDKAIGKTTIQVLKVNIMNPPRDMNEQEVRRELYRTRIVKYNNLTVYYDHYVLDDVV
jgi:hypothetical protein